MGASDSQPVDEAEIKRLEKRLEELDAENELLIKEMSTISRHVEKSDWGNMNMGNLADLIPPPLPVKADAPAAAPPGPPAPKPPEAKPVKMDFWPSDADLKKAADEGKKKVDEWEKAWKEAIKALPPRKSGPPPAPPSAATAPPTTPAPFAFFPAWHPMIAPVTAAVKPKEQPGTPKSKVKASPLSSAAPRTPSSRVSTAQATPKSQRSPSTVPPTRPVKADHFPARGPPPATVTSSSQPLWQKQRMPDRLLLDLPREGWKDGWPAVPVKSAPPGDETAEPSFAEKLPWTSPLGDGAQAQGKDDSAFEAKRVPKSGSVAPDVEYTFDKPFYGATPQQMALTVPHKWQQSLPELDASCLYPAKKQDQAMILYDPPTARDTESIRAGYADGDWM